VTQVRGNVSVTENAASARVNGFEAELAIRPMKGLTIGGNFAYTDAKYVKFTSVDPVDPAGVLQDLSGNTLTQAPKTAFSVYAAKTWKFDDYDVTARGDYNYTGKQYFTPFDSKLAEQKGYGIGSFSLRVQHKDGLSIEGYIRNIGNKKAISQTYVSSLSLFGAPVLGTLIAPRTYGVTLGYDF
jgi:iron complex outermembrane receptor protein